MATKAQVELVLQRVLQSLPPERFPVMFPLAMRAINTTLLAPLETGRDVVDLGIVLAIASLLAAQGPATERKQVAFKVLVHRSGRHGDQVSGAPRFGRHKLFACFCKGLGFLGSRVSGLGDGRLRCWSGGTGDQASGDYRIWSPQRFCLGLLIG